MKRMLALFCGVVLMMNLTACGKAKGVAAAAVTDIWTSMENSVGENIPMSQDLDEATLKKEYGIDKSMVEDYVAKTPTVKTRAEEFFLAKVKKGKMEDVEKGIQKRVAELETTWKTGLPEQYELVKNYKISKKGDYIFFTVSSKAEELVNTFKSSI